MKNRLQKWGNSSGVRIPKAYLESLGLKSGDIVNVDKEDDRVVITKVEENIETLKERISKYKRKDKVKPPKEENDEKITWDEDEEFTWDDERGNEEW